ncbi:DUF402 domain-containing protein [Thermopolyspora sp. NPDC052614]|uniref:DUF402 domain-containing protein n=1 Tax=Thermopolyspora sp. NPDC052614 TaxID=3155682 RepID=UPI003425A1BD
MEPQSVRVVYRKFDGSLHWHHSARYLGEDEYGRWVGCEPGAIGRRGYEPEVVWHHAFVILFPRGAWWTASFNAQPRTTRVYCDVTTPPRWNGDEVTAIDLDLDVLRFDDGRIVLDDQDEFAEHRVKYGYPPEIVAGAETAASWLLEAVRSGREPFGDGYEPWLRQVSGLPETI